jgi:hypothetical protein
MRDSYERFFSAGYISKDQFFEFGLKETIYSPLDRANEGWRDLKQKIYSNSEVFIRGFGRDASGTHLFLDLYKNVVGNKNVQKDPTNNAEPTKLIKELTGYSKSKSAKHESIRNYQVSHIFGRTKNVFAFTAPWNIVYMPKMLDPFTGHEAKGAMIDEYTKLFQEQGYKHFQPLIEDFNEIMSSGQIVNGVKDHIDLISENSEISEKEIIKLKKAINEEFSTIEINA